MRRTIRRLLAVMASAAICSCGAENEPSADGPEQTSTTRVLDLDFATSTTEPAPTTTTRVGRAPEIAEHLIEEAQTLTAEASALRQEIDGVYGGGGDLDSAQWDHVFAISDQFYDLSRLVPPGLHPDVDHLARQLIFDAGNAVSPFVFAPGFTADDWPTWSDTMDAGTARIPETAEELRAAAAANPAVEDVDPRSEQAAAQSLLSIVMVRSFGHGNTPDAPASAVFWVSELPPLESGSDIPSCPMRFDTGMPATDGFVPGVGGCAVLLDPEILLDASAGIEEWRANPLVPYPPVGELVTVWWADDHWEVMGSVE